MIYNTAQDTTVGSMTDIRVITRNIRAAMIADSIHLNSCGLLQHMDIKPAFVIGSETLSGQIPFFSLPILIEADKLGTFLFSDMRPFVRPDQDGNVTIKNIMEYQFTRSLNVLTAAWLSEDYTIIRNELTWAGLIFAMVIGEIIGKRYALDGRDQLITTITAHLYYQMLFDNDSEIDETEIERMCLQTTRLVKAPAPLVLEVAKNAGVMTNVAGFCKGLQNAINNVRLQDFNTGLLLNLMGNCWYGHKNHEIIPVALEHPPTWCAIVYSAATERSFKNTMVGRVADRYGKYGQADFFLKAYSSIMTTYTTAVSHESVLVFPEFE